MSDDRREYLGDGVYAYVTPEHIVLATSDGVRDTNTIYLDDATLQSFLLWLKRQGEKA